MATFLDSNIVVSEFELQSRYYEGNGKTTLLLEHDMVDPSYKENGRLISGEGEREEKK